MASNCRVCQYRARDIGDRAMSSQLDVCIITLQFKFAITDIRTESHIALNTFLNNIVDDAETTPDVSTFTAWSPCVTDPKAVIIITTSGGACSTEASPVFDVIRERLESPPRIQRVWLGLDAASLAPSSQHRRIACDVVLLSTADTDVASSMGREFGWDPSKASLAAQLRLSAPSTFGVPGDLVRDFWAWAEVAHLKPRTLSASTGSTAPSSSSLFILNPSKSEECLSPPGREDKSDETTLAMIFQWTNHADGTRFKDPESKSYGPNGEEASGDFWERKMALPVRQLKDQGAKLESYTLELRAVEPRITSNVVPEKNTGRGSRTRRLTNAATELGERVSKLWR